MLIGVMSDSHDQADNIRKAVAIFNQEKVELVVHCGDWVAPFTLYFYQGLKCPIKGIFGNNDADRFRHLQRMEKYSFELTYEERFLELELESRKIAVWHGDYRDITDALITCGKYDAVFHGHFHIPENKMIGKTLSLCAGTLMPETSETIKGASIALYDTKTNSARLIPL